MALLEHCVHMHQCMHECNKPWAAAIHEIHLGNGEYPWLWFCQVLRSYLVTKSPRSVKMTIHLLQYTQHILFLQWLSSGGCSQFSSPTSDPWDEACCRQDSRVLLHFTCFYFPLWPQMTTCFWDTTTSNTQWQVWQSLPFSPVRTC